MDVSELISMVITAHQLHGNMSNKHSSLYSNLNVSMFAIYRRKKRLKYKRYICFTLWLPAMNYGIL